MGQKFYHGMLMPLHDSMPSFMNFRRVLDLLEFKKQVSQCLRPSDGGRVSEIQTSGHCGSAGKIEKLGFLIPVIPKHA